MVRGSLQNMKCPQTVAGWRYTIWRHMNPTQSQALSEGMLQNMRKLCAIDCRNLQGSMLMRHRGRWNSGDYGSSCKCREVWRSGIPARSTGQLHEKPVPGDNIVVLSQVGQKLARRFYNVLHTQSESCSYIHTHTYIYIYTRIYIIILYIYNCMMYTVYSGLRRRWWKKMFYDQLS